MSRKLVNFLNYTVSNILQIVKSLLVLISKLQSNYLAFYYYLNFLSVVLTILYSSLFFSCSYLFKIYKLFSPFFMLVMFPFLFTYSLLFFELFTSSRYSLENCSEISSSGSSTITGKFSDYFSLILYLFEEFVYTFGLLNRRCDF